MTALPFIAGEGFAALQQAGSGCVHQEVQTQLMGELTVYIFGEKGLVQPQGALNAGGDIQLLLKLPLEGVLGCLAQGYPAAGQVVVGGAFISHSEHLVLV